MPCASSALRRLRPVAEVRIQLERADQPDVIALIKALDDFQMPLYPPESHHGIDIEALCKANVRFAVVRDAGGMAIGCGAVVFDGADAELKRMYVDPAFRGRGIARVVLGYLEQAAIDHGCRSLVLETGVLQKEAIGLYESAGFLPCEPFGDYRPDPHSLFLRKEISP